MHNAKIRPETTVVTFPVIKTARTSYILIKSHPQINQQYNRHFKVYLYNLGLNKDHLKLHPEDLLRGQTSTGHQINPTYPKHGQRLL